MDGFTDQLLQTKLQRPRIPHDLVLRSRLFERLNRGVRGPLTLVCAGAGYGKTTLVSSWIESRDAESNSNGSWPVAWISLDETDSNLQRFLQYFVAGLRTIFAGACPKTLELLRARQDPPLAELVTTLSNEIARFESDFVLILDDHQSITDPTVSEMLTQLMRHWPEPMHLVLISRQDPALPLPSLRAKGLLTEIRTRDLRFTSQEATSYLNMALPTLLDHSAGELLERNIEGWIAGLQLAALSLRFTGNPMDFLAGLSGTEADFAEYLVGEVLVRAPVPIQAFLLQTAFLDHFCARLCQLVIAGEDPEWNPQRCIDWLERANFFIIPLDNRKEWYRYHHIFRGVLQAQAMPELGPERVAELQRKAAVWFDGLGWTDEALRYAVAAHDLDMVARVIEHGLCDVLNREDRPTLERWLSLLPEDMVEARPGVLVIKAWSLHFSWQLGAAAKVIQRLALLLEQGGGATSAADEQTVRAQMLVLYGQESYFTNQFARSIAYCREALTLLPERWAYGRSAAMFYLGLAMQACGQDREAGHLLIDGYRALSNKTGTYGLRLLLGLCLMYNLQAEDLERIRQTAQRLLEGAEVSNLGVMRGWARYFLGLTHYQRNELTPAMEHFLELVGHPYAANLGALRDGAQRLVRICHSLGQATRARQVLDLLSQLDLDNAGQESDLTASVRASLALLEGDLEGAARWADAFGEPVPDRAQLFEYSPHLSKAWILIARGMPADVEAALEILAAFYDLAKRGHNTRLKIEVLALRAIALHAKRAQGQVDEWQAALETAVSLARPGGWVRPFIELGSRMREALSELAGHAEAHSNGSRPFGEMLSRILAAIPDETDSAADEMKTVSSTRVSTVIPMLPESLTPREVEILSLLAGPLSLKEIARKLNVTPNTVKSHTINIYGKLGVNKRRDAVTKAQALGILSSN